MERGEWQVTVLNGKESLSVAIPPPASSAKWLEVLQDTLAQRSGVAVAHQKLLFRGKQLTLARARELTNGAKLMLLKNASFHKSDRAAAAASAPPPRKDGVAATGEALAGTTTPAAAVSQRLGMDRTEIDAHHVLLQATRGKSVYEFLFPTSATIAAVKSRVGGAIGLSGAAVRLILKGKTPPDETALAAFVGPASGNRVLKCMVLLSVKQHDLAEHEEAFRVVQNELTGVEAECQTLERVLFRNFLSTDEARVRLHGLENHIGRLESNLAIVDDQLKATKLVESSASTARALKNAQRECHALKSRVDELTKRFDRGQ